MSAHTQVDLERMTVPALKELLKPSGEKPARLKKDLIQQVLSLTSAEVTSVEVTSADHIPERIALREIFIDIWNLKDKNGAALRNMFIQFFDDLEDHITMEGITSDDIAVFARDLIVSQL